MEYLGDYRNAARRGGWLGWLRGASVLLVAVVLCLAPRPAVAVEFTFDNGACAMSPPKGWHPPTKLERQPGMLGGAQSPDGRRLVLLSMKPWDGKPLTPQRIANINKGYDEASGETLVWDKEVEVMGMKGYARFGKAQHMFQTVTVLTVFIPAGHKIYAIQGIDAVGDASKNPEIVASIESFRFLRDPMSSPYEWGFRIGRIVRGLWVWAVLFGLAVLIARLVTRSRGRKSVEQPAYMTGTLPPPPPPPPPPI